MTLLELKERMALYMPRKKGALTTRGIPVDEMKAWIEALENAVAVEHPHGGCPLPRRPFDLISTEPRDNVVTCSAFEPDLESTEYIVGVDPTAPKPMSFWARRFPWLFELFR